MALHEFWRTWQFSSGWMLTEGLSLGFFEETKAYHFLSARTQIVQVVWKLFVASRQLLTVPFAQSRPSCGLSTKCFAYYCLMAKACPIPGVYFSFDWEEGEEEGPPPSSWKGDFVVLLFAKDKHLLSMFDTF